MSRLTGGVAWTTLAVAPLIATLALFVVVLRSGEAAPLGRRAIPREAYRPDRCTWSCHNRGCAHAPVLPRVLTGDGGLFGIGLRVLHHAGERLAAGGAGYRLANLILFCAFWPGAMYGLWLVALWQRRRLRALAREAR